ncbi:hypothetical protein PMG71_04735 [Roseofilum sp. BLCC_M154]|uniref:Uncharacterized protein n=1 Tax=Roseofilum acuticapitatum BLCC-M154 TaxID=3022444 RepID=A0ABT7AQZ6_9CYAN|nr:hypothetical protein [Roseofilum acuticapitatum]MDJ1168726.1 hypothetical protein [Roseofilum acuticapitatum BLCC-M154]
MQQENILDEIHQLRAEHAKAFDYDLDAMFADWQKRQSESEREVVSLPPKQGLIRRWIRVKQDQQQEAQI